MPIAVLLHSAKRE